MIELIFAGILFCMVLALNKHPLDVIEKFFYGGGFVGLYLVIVLLIIEVTGLILIYLEVI